MDRETWSGLERGEERCAACTKELAGETSAFAALFSSGEGFRRRDYCEACFRALPEKPASFWRRAPARPTKKSESGKAKRASRRRDLDAMLELFERLSGDEKPPVVAPSAPADAAAAGLAGPSTPAPIPVERKKSDDEQAKLRYLLALALVRRRRLELVDLAREGGADCLILRRSGQAELLTVSAPALGEADLERLSRELEAEVGLA